MTTGAVNASVRGTVYTDNKLAIYQVDKVLLPLDFVLPKAKAPAPALAAAKADSPKSDKNKSSADGSGDGGESDNDDAVAVDSSAGFNVQIMWVPQALGVAFVAAAMT